MLSGKKKLVHCFVAWRSAIKPLLPKGLSSTNDGPYHFMVDYLIDTLGFPRDKAIKASKRLTALKSPQNPNSVLRSFKDHGFTEPHIRRLILWRPDLLSANVEKTLEPKFKVLQDLGFSQQALTDLIRSNPNTLRHCESTIAERIGFWKSLLGNDDERFQAAFGRNRNIINHNIAKRIAPRIALLKSHGISDDGVRRIVLSGRQLILRSRTFIEACLKQTRELGFPGSNTMHFVRGLITVSSVSRVSFKAKMDVLKSFGWSEGEFFAALLKCPTFMQLSEVNIRAKMEFLLERAGCTPSYVALNPFLLGLSLEKRLRPRYHVLQILRSKGAIKTELDIGYTMKCAEILFVEKFIPRFKKAAPDLLEIYLAACVGQVPLL